MSTNPITTKKIMAYAGLFWFIYLIFHMLANLNYFLGEQYYNDFFIWFNSGFILNFGLVSLLFLSLIYHFIIAIKRQFGNNKQRLIEYRKSYPKTVPRFIAWSGALMLLSFIVFHYIHMETLETNDLYNGIQQAFSQPIILIIYALGLIALSAHLHHSLMNVTQTLGISCNCQKCIVLTILIVLMGGFISVPLAVIL